MTNQDRSEAPLASKTAQLIVGGFSTECSACGGNANLNEDAHIHGGPKSMWDPGSGLSDENGCGAVFTNVDDEVVQSARRW